MKCKNWSNKLNNFVVRKLKSFKINGQQQVLSSTMPAMPNEKTTPISLDESNFDEIKMKEHQLDTSSSSTSTSSSNTSVTFITCNGSHNNKKNNINNSCNYEDCCNSITDLSLRPKLTSITGTEQFTELRPNNIEQTTSNRINLCNNISNSNYRNNSNELIISTTSTTSTSSSSSSPPTGPSRPFIYKSRRSLNNIIKTIPDISTKFANNLINSAITTPSSSSSSSSLPSTTIPTASSVTTAATNNRLNNSSSGYNNQIDSNNKLQQQNYENDTRKINGMIPKINDTTTTTTSSSGTAITKSTTSTTQQPQYKQNYRSNVPTKKSVNDFIFGKYIGEGSFSTVYLASDIHTKKEYAIKVCEKHHIIREKKQEYIKREREVMHLVSNVPGFVNLYCTFQDDSRLYFAMTHAKNGDLLPYINKVGSFDIECTQHYAAELVLACENMHKRGIIHRDLKPENILLDENMHTLIADFGSAKILDNSSQNLMMNGSNISSTSAAAGSSPPKTTSETINNRTTTSTASTTRTTNHQHQKSDSSDGGVDSDDINIESNRRRKCSFVGTAQYVTPEILQNGPITRSVDLWALGCIIYQMISGLPPFRGTNDYFIFKEILGLNLIFPNGFDKNAEDLVRQLLKINPMERLGAQDKTDIYKSIRDHKFFDGINWDTIRDKTPPPIYPYLPGVNKDEELRSQYRVPDNLEPGLDNIKLTRLLGLSLLGFEAGINKTEPEGVFDLSDEIDQHKNIEAQKTDNWDAFADGEVILKKGYINKRKGLFARKRMLLLTTGPRLIYIDPVQMVKKGEIPWSSELRVEPKNFKIFFVHTPNRTYYLEDPEGYALNWVDSIENIRKSTYESS